MISRISGKLKQKKEDTLLLEVDGGLCYEVLVPKAVMRVLDEHSSADDKVELVTFYYHQVKPDRNIPMLVGFLNDIEKEFFECFITVSGVGPKAAVKALSLPISVIAEAIDAANYSLLKTLPGIGEQRAREIVAKLQGKVGKFCLIQDKIGAEKGPAVKEDIQEEALNVLLQLQYKKTEAKEMIKRAIERNPSLNSAEDILNEVYRQRSAG